MIREQVVSREQATALANGSGPSLYFKGFFDKSNLCTSFFRSTHFLWFFSECYSISLELLPHLLPLPPYHYYLNLPCMTIKLLFGSTCPLYYDKQLKITNIRLCEFFTQTQKMLLSMSKNFHNQSQCYLFTCRKKKITSGNISNSLFGWASHCERGWRLLVCGQKFVKIQNLIKSSENYHTFALNIQAFSHYS